jgi:hypothetical protein
MRNGLRDRADLLAFLSGRESLAQTFRWGAGCA